MFAFPAGRRAAVRCCCGSPKAYSSSNGAAAKPNPAPVTRFCSWPCDGGQANGSLPPTRFSDCRSSRSRMLCNRRSWRPPAMRANPIGGSMASRSGTRLSPRRGRERSSMSGKCSASSSAGVGHRDCAPAGGRFWRLRPRQPSQSSPFVGISSIRRRPTPPPAGWNSSRSQARPLTNPSPRATAGIMLSSLRRISTTTGRSFATPKAMPGRSLTSFATSTASTSNCASIAQTTSLPGSSPAM